MNDREYSKRGIKRQRRKKQNGGVLRPLVVFAAFSLSVYSIVNIISQQVQITQLKQEKEELSEQISEAEQLNDEYTRLLASDDAAYMEKIAVETLGYAYPNERRFYVVEAQ